MRCKQRARNQDGCNKSMTYNVLNRSPYYVWMYDIVNSKMAWLNNFLTGRNFFWKVKHKRAATIILSLFRANRNVTWHWIYIYYTVKEKFSEDNLRIDHIKVFLHWFLLKFLIFTTRQSFKWLRKRYLTHFWNTIDMNQQYFK